MKKILLPLFAVILAFATSCSQQSGNPFEVFYGEFCAQITLSCEGAECTAEYNSKEKALRFTAPDELSGYKLRLDGGKAYLSYGDTELAVSEYAGRTALLCEAVFSAEEKDVTKISAKKTEAGTLTEVKTKRFTYGFLPNGTPDSVKGEFDGMSFEMTVLSFTGEMK